MRYRKLSNMIDSVFPASWMEPANILVQLNQKRHRRRGEHAYCCIMPHGFDGALAALIANHVEFGDGLRAHADGDIEL